MNNAFYITTFNDPDSFSVIAPKMDKIVDGSYTKIISDQSDSEFAAVYEGMAKDMGWSYVHNENGGAQKAKHDIIRHAAKNNFAFMAQMSEDFDLNPPDLSGPIPSGSDCFFEVAHHLLVERPCVTFVHWTMVRPSYLGWQSGYSFGVHDAMWRIGSFHRNTKLLYVSGDICLFNWPYTARVKTLNSLLDQANIIGENSEVNLARVSVGHGVSLLAFPVRHTDRPRKGMR